jgi:peptidoglycan/LPS O-acetylase OafA/YrhL
MLDRMGADSLDELGAGHPGSTPEAALSKDGNRRRIEQPFAVKPPQRLQELDSLRGVASLTVVWHHWIWIFRDAVVPWYILPFVSGREAVILFFVLSGFVLSLGSPVTSPAQYVEFALRRIGRIYLPFVAAIALSGVCCVLFLGRSLPLADWYYDSWHEPVSLAIVLKELTLSPTVTLNPSFWSLSYEIAISLLFPSFWWLMRRRPGAWSVTALVGCKLIDVWVWRRGFGSTYVGMLLYYLTFFMFGVALARGRHLLSRKVENMSGAILWSALGVSLAVYVNSILLHLQTRKTDMLTAIGAAGLITLCQSPRISIGLRSRVARFFGRVSYSLYLVHGVVLLALLDMFFGRLPKWGMGVLYGVVSVALSYLFCLAVEEPAHRLGKRWARQTR